jgi:hypothetical protein
MEDEDILRKQAVELHLQGVSITDISLKLGRSRQWVHKWIKRYYQTKSDHWFESISTTPKQVSRKIQSGVEETIIRIRQDLQCQKYSQKGALSILYEFERIGMNPPSMATINRVLKRNNLIEESSMGMIKKKIIRVTFSMSNRWIWSGLNTCLEALGSTSLT